MDTDRRHKMAGSETKDFIVVGISRKPVFPCTGSLSPQHLRVTDNEFKSSAAQPLMSLIKSQGCTSKTNVLRCTVSLVSVMYQYSFL